MDALELNMKLYREGQDLDLLLDEVIALAGYGRETDGAHHKRHFARTIADLLNRPLVTEGEAIAP
jgi:hypothetical protein